MPVSKEELRRNILNKGVNVCGFANVNSFSEMNDLRNPGKILPDCQTVVVMGIPFLDGSFKSSSTIPYTILRNKLSEMLDKISIEICYEIEMMGEQAIPTGAIEQCNWDPSINKNVGLISLKYAAEQAGIGVIGKNTLLLSPKYGNKLWLAALLTTAKITPDEKLNYNPCKPGCNICIESCPVKALDGSKFMDQGKCWDHAFGEPESGGEWRIKCFSCRAKCPFSKGYKIPRNL